MSTPTENLRIPFEEAQVLEGQFNWNTLQPTRLDTTAGYVDLAKSLSPYLDAYTEFLTDMLGVDIDFCPVSVKSCDSAERKLSDTTIQWEPERINDYLRITGTIPNSGKKSIQDMQSIVSYLEGAEETVGFKNQFSFPDPKSGFRSLKIHTLVEDPENPKQRIVAEIIIQHEGMEKANDITRSLRDMERDFGRLAENAYEIFGDNTKGRAQATLASLNSMRRAVHNAAAQKCGINALLDPSVAKNCENVVNFADRLHGVLPAARDHMMELVKPFI